MTDENLKILIVEDEPDICSRMQSYLGRRGFLVSTTSSGKEALSMIKVVKPDVVLLDLKLRDFDGREVIQALRQYDTQTKVIVITGQLLEPEEIETIHSLGISAYFHKPLSLEEMGKAIQEILGKKVSPPIISSKNQSLRPANATCQKSLPSVVHELSNLLGVIRNRCENFTLNIKEGLYKDKTDKELVQMALEIMQGVEKTIDKAAKVVESIAKDKE